MREGTVERGRAGFTLVELLLVMALIALVLGVGMGAIARLDLGDRVAVALVQDALRSAQNFAAGRAAPARVRIDAAAGTLRTEGMQVVGTWHFEELPPRGAFGLEGSSTGGRVVEDGFQGNAVSFAGEPSRSRIEIPVQDDPAWAARDGLTIRVALRPTGAGGGAALALGESAGIETTDALAVRGWIAAEVADEQGGVRRGGRIPVESLPRTLVADRWSVVELQYDRRELRLLVDGVLAARVDELAPVWTVDGPLVLSPSAQPWPGSIDSLVVACVVAHAQTRLPDGVAFAAGAPAEIRFAAGGGLDRGVHREPVRLALDFDDGRKAGVLVHLFGTVE